MNRNVTTQNPTRTHTLAIRRLPIRAKSRTREHVIADLGYHHFEGYVLECGFVAEPVFHDYGYDSAIFTYTESGELEPGWIFVQLKATDRLTVLADGRTISFRVNRRDLRVWLREFVPVILIVYDAQSKRAYWLYVQDYFAQASTKRLFSKSGMISVRIPMKNRLNRRAVMKFARYRDERYARQERRENR